MRNLLISVLVTAVLAVVFYTVLRGSADRRVGALRAWADAAGWEPGADFPPGSRVPFDNTTFSVTGERDGYRVTLAWVGDESLETVCRVTLVKEHGKSDVRRKAFSKRLPPPDRYEIFGHLSPAARDVLAASTIDFLTVSGRQLTATSRDWLEPDQLDAFINDTVAVCAATDGAAAL